LNSLENSKNPNIEGYNKGEGGGRWINKHLIWSVKEYIKELEGK
jgi:hypothetical protein